MRIIKTSEAQRNSSNQPGARSSQLRAGNTCQRIADHQ